MPTSKRGRKGMKKLAYMLLTSILALSLIEALSTAHACRVKYATFEEQLNGTISNPGLIKTPDGWIVTMRQVITGTGDGTLPGSPVIFTMLIQTCFKEDIGKSFTSGKWTIVASGGQGSISGQFLGQGTDPNNFSGTFKSFMHTATGIYSGKMIYGDFESKYLEPDTYGAPRRYQATWTGTIKQTG
jgi:hypothetical protein